MMRNSIIAYLVTYEYGGQFVRVRVKVFLFVTCQLHPTVGGSFSLMGANKRHTKYRVWAWALS